MKVLQLTRKQRAAALADDADGERTGIFTSGIVATHTGHQIALFFTGVRHAGENLARGARPPKHRSTRADPDVRWSVAQCPERVSTQSSLNAWPMPGESMWN